MASLKTLQPMACLPISIRPRERRHAKLQVNLILTDCNLELKPQSRRAGAPPPAPALHSQHNQPTPSPTREALGGLK
jgi:hypothetical protein